MRRDASIRARRSSFFLLLNDTGVVVWPRYADASDQRVNFGDEVTVVSGFRRAECELWWSIYDRAFDQ